MTTPTYEDAITLVRQLDRLAQARLIAEVAQDLAVAPTTTPIAQRPMTAAEARTAWAQLRESIRALPRPRRTLAEQLEADRAERDHSLAQGRGSR